MSPNDAVNCGVVGRTVRQGMRPLSACRPPPAVPGIVMACTSEHICE
jgi:hypothetical protein